MTNRIFRFFRVCGSAPKKEQLLSNLLEVKSFFPRIYTAKAHHRFAREIWQELTKTDKDVTGEWVLKPDGTMLSCHNLRRSPWSRVCQSRKVQEVDAKQWAFSRNLDERRDFVWLLKQCLRVITKQMSLWYDRDRFCFYYAPTRNLSARTVQYRSLRKETSRIVFRAYMSKKEPQRVAYYRHSAFEHRFVCYDNAWYLEISPTYFFTWDGVHVSPFCDERLTKMKQIERNAAVLGQVVMWADLLSRKGDLLGKDVFLQFGNLVSFDVEVGINDHDWLKREEGEDSTTLQAEMKQPSLFDLLS